MFNSNSSTEINISAVSGTITKTYVKSWFQRFHLQSHTAGQILTEGYGHCVLQVMVCGDMQVIAEIITKKDLEEALREGGRG